MLALLSTADTWFQRISKARAAYVQLRIAEKYVTEVIELVTIMAEYQETTGYLGQSGFGGSGIWDPELIEYEYEYIRHSTVV